MSRAGRESPSIPLRAPLRLVPSPRARGADDAELVRGLVAEEDWAVREFWGHYAPLVYGILDRALGSASESEDLTQEVFLGLYSGIKRLRDPSALRSFVVASAVLRLRRHLRWKRVRSFLTLSKTGSVPDLPATGVDGPARELLRKVYGALDRLAVEDRTAFVLRNVEGLTLQEVATYTGASLATAKRRIRRAAEKIEEFARSEPDLAPYLTEGAKLGGPP